MLSPKPRFRFYGSPKNYMTALAALLTGRVHSGDDVARLEARLQQKLGKRHAIAVPQCRVGMYLALKQLLKPGQEVILSPYTIYDAVNMVLTAGGTPVFADIDPETCNIDLVAVDRLIGPSTAGVMITHLHGLTCDTPAFRALCDSRGLWLMEDAAQAFGATTGNGYAGALGTAGVYSFGRAKNVNGFYGGAVVTDDDALAAGIRQELADWPQFGTKPLYKRVINCLIGDVATMPLLFQLITFRIFQYGALRGIERINKMVDTEDAAARRDKLPPHYARRMTPMQARAILDQLGAIDDQTEERQATAEVYFKELAGIEGLRLPPHRHDSTHIYLAFPIQVSDPWALIKYLMRHGVDLAVQHYHNTADLPCFKEFFRDCSNARLVSKSLVLLPTYPGYGTAEARRTAHRVRAYFRDERHDSAAGDAALGRNDGS
jgi:dTDP-4-amino-4,6-dideoxygalactose transaminase